MRVNLNKLIISIGMIVRLAMSKGFKGIDNDAAAGAFVWLFGTVCSASCNGNTNSDFNGV